MARLVLRRCGWSVPVLLLATVIVFTLVSFGGDPLAARREQPNVDQDVLRRLEAEYHLDRPRPVQYLRWLGDFVRGDWGTSYDSGLPVREVILRALPNSLVLLGAVAVLTAAATMAVGVAGAVYQHSRVDRLLAGLAYFGLSMPVFWFGLVLQLVLVILPMELFGARLFYLSGMYTTGREGSLGNLLQHLALPAITLSLPLVAALSRFQRAALIDALHADHVRTARSKGLGERAVVVKHALRNSLGSLVSLSALQIAALVGGAVVTERIFAWPGMGTALLRAVQTSDYPVTLSWLAVTAVAVVGANLAADVVNALLDPRVQRT